MTEIPDADTMRAFNKAIVDEFRANGGKVVAAAPGFGEYQSKTTRVIPLFELIRA
jgi:hypothetical protein